MHCPFCRKEETKVIDSRLVGDGNQIRRRRECNACGERFTTYEMAELVMPRIIKADDARVPFDEQKLRAGIHKAIEKRPVSIEQVEASVNRLMHRLRDSGEREISAALLGEWVMEELRNLDEVAYVRFASVYRKFQDIEEFQREITRMQSMPKSEQVVTND